MSRRFLIIVTGWNCANRVQRCYDSIRTQDYDNFLCVMISDGSKDDTNKRLHAITDTRFITERYPLNEGAAKRRYEAIHKYGKPDDIVVLVGMDDELLQGCLTTILEQYEAGKWMTYGNWVDQNGEMLPEGFLHFDDETHADRSYRQVKYRSTAPNTFYQHIFTRIPEDDFKLNGKWIDSTTESETMFSCLEMCGKDRIGIIEKPIYLYNRNLPTGTLRRQGVKYKYDIYNQIIKRQKKDLIP